MLANDSEISRRIDGIFPMMVGRQILIIIHLVLIIFHVLPKKKKKESQCQKLYVRKGT